MVFPLVPVIIVVGTVATAGAGAVAGGIGGVQISIAQKQIHRHGQRHEKHHDAHLANVDLANEALRGFGRTQELAQQEVIFRMRDFLERHAKQVLAHEHLILDGVDGSNTQVVGMAKLDPDVAGWVRGVVGSVVAGAATPLALRTAAGGFAKASTGAAISALHGAAAENATLAFLGGGSLIAGGGGVKLGKTMLGVAMIGPMRRDRMFVLANALLEGSRQLLPADLRDRSDGNRPRRHLRPPIRKSRKSLAVQPPARQTNGQPRRGLVPA